MRIVIAVGKETVADYDVRDAGQIGDSGVRAYRVRAIRGQRVMPTVLATVCGDPTSAEELAASVLRVVG